MRLAVVLLVIGCGATSTQAPDGGADADADADADGDSDADLDCSSAGGPAGTVPMWTCGPPSDVPSAPLCAAEVGPCERDEQCAMVSLDPCCPVNNVAVLEPSVAGVTARVGTCNVGDPGCSDCPLPDPRPECLGGRCVLVDCSNGC
jgi:hypothetical protein